MRELNTSDEGSDQPKMPPPLKKPQYSQQIKIDLKFKMPLFIK